MGNNAPLERPGRGGLQLTVKDVTEETTFEDILGELEDYLEPLHCRRDSSEFLSFIARSSLRYHQHMSNREIFSQFVTRQQCNAQSRHIRHGGNNYLYAVK